MKEEKENPSLEVEPQGSPSVPSIGRRLHSARLKKGLTIETINQETRISKGFIAAMEEDRFNDMPGGSYLVSFLKGYCEYLELDFKEIKELLISQGRLDSPSLEEVHPNFVPPKPPTPNNISPKKSSEILNLNPQKIFWTVLVLLLVGLAMVKSRKGPTPQGKKKGQALAIGNTVAAVPKAAPAKQKGESLDILFNRAVFLRVAIDGQRRFSGRVVSGTRQTWQAKKEVTLWTRDPGALKASFNGVPLQLPIPDAKGNFHIKALLNSQASRRLGKAIVNHAARKKPVSAIPGETPVVPQASGNQPPDSN